MSAAGIRAGRAFVEIGANDSSLVKGLRAAQAKLKKFGMGLSAIGGGMSAASASVLGPLAASVQVFAGSGDELSKMADRTGASVEALSELRHAAAQSDVEVAQLQTGLNRMSKVVGEAATGSDGAAESLAHLGLTAQQLQSLPVDKQFELIADALAGIEDPAIRTMRAMDIFGKGGASLMPMMTTGAAGIQALREEARKLGLQVSGADAAAATLYGDTLSNLWTVVKDVAFEIGAALAPALTSVIQTITPVIVGVAEWISKNGELVVWVAAVAAGVGAAGAALVAFGVASMAAAAAISGLIALGGVIATVFAAVVSPIGLAVAAIAALGYMIATQTEFGAAMVNWLGEQFSALFATVSRTVGNIVGLLQAGQLGAAMELGWTAIDAAWQTGMAGLKNAWTDFTTGILNVWTNTVSSIAKFFSDSWSFIEIGWIESVGFFTDSWTSFTNFLTKTWNSTVGFIQKAWVALKSLFDSEINVQAEMQKIDDQTSAQNAASDSATQGILDSRFNERYQRQAQIDQRAKDINKTLEEDRQREINRRNSQAQAAKDARNARAAAAQAKLDAANKQAEEAISQAAPNALKKPGAPQDIFQEQAKEAEKGVQKAVQNQGTFSAAQALQFGPGDDVQRKIAGSSEETARNTGRLIKELPAAIAKANRLRA
jgi:TP901 family phage tail tape measure protein